MGVWWLHGVKWRCAFFTHLQSYQFGPRNKGIACFFDIASCAYAAPPVRGNGEAACYI